MRVTSPTFNPQRRRGVILLVVLAMLTLLTVIGVTFVLYSDSAESTARIAMEGERLDALDIPLMVPNNTEDLKPAFTVSVVWNCLARSSHSL